VVPTILGAAHLIEVLDGLGIPRERQRVVLNRYSNFPGNVRPEAVTLRLGRDVDHVIPYEKKLLVAANVGTPYVLSAGRFFSRFPRAVAQLAEEVEALWVPTVLPAPAPDRPKPSAGGATDNHKVIP